MTPFQRHCHRWKDGCGASICPSRTRLVLARGTLPCDVLFVGEAPGEAENVIGRPFVGPAGKLLDHICSEAFAGYVLRWAFTNVVACIPRLGDGEKAAEPDEESIRQCRPRLEEFVRMAEPRVVVAVGKLAYDHLQPGYKHSTDVGRAKVVHITHPAAILRANVAGQGLMVQRCVVQIQDALEEVFGAGN